MDAASLIDPVSAAVVGGGTLLATVLRAGPRACGGAMAAVARLPHRGFDAAALRSDLARQVQDIRTDGLLRADPHRTGDAAIDEAARALIETRSLAAFRASLDHHRQHRRHRAETAAGTLAMAAEAAPAFGLAGTLLALSQLPDGGLQAGFGGAVAAAVLTTLYGLLLAHLLFAPLAQAVTRASEREEAERGELLDWAASQLEAACAVPVPDRRWRRQAA